MRQHLGILPVHICHAHTAFIRALHDAADDQIEVWQRKRHELLKVSIIANKHP